MPWPTPAADPYSSYQGKAGGSGAEKLTESFELMDKAKANSKGKTWKREDLYRAFQT